MHKRLFIFLFPLTLLWACAPTRFVEPLDKGELSIGGNFGGPLIEFGAPIPVPLSAIEVGYGIDTNFTVHGGVHTTALAFGNAQIDGGVTYQFLDQKKWVPNISVTPGFNTSMSFSSRKLKFWPTLDLNAFWNYGEKNNYVYVGASNYFELSRTMANDQPQQYPILFSPQIGNVFKGKSEKWQLSVEVKWLAPYVRSDYAFVPYQNITGNNGAVGVYVGFRKILGRKK